MGVWQPEAAAAVGSQVVRKEGRGCGGKMWKRGGAVRSGSVATQK